MSIDIDAIKANNPIENIIQQFTGQELIKHKIRCPFHEENTPSLHVYEDGGWKCFGCGKFGDCLDFVGYYLFGHSYDPAKHFIDVVDRLGALDIKSLPAPDKLTKPATPAPKLSISLEQIMHWHETMPNSRRQYWHERGLNDQTIGEFLLGWDGQRYVIPSLYRFVPFGVKRRQSEIDDGIAAKYTQIVNSKIGIFNADMLLTAKTVVICEGEIDAMLMHQHSWHAVSSTGGAGSWKAEWAKFFTHVRSTFILYDNDKAGEEGARKVQQSIRRAKIIRLPDGIKDIGELFGNHADPIDWLKTNLV